MLLDFTQNEEAGAAAPMIPQLRALGGEYEHMGACKTPRVRRPNLRVGRCPGRRNQSCLLALVEYDKLPLLPLREA